MTVRRDLRRAAGVAVRAAAFVAVVRRLAGGGRGAAPLDSDVGDAPPLSVIVPARNEAERLPALLTALRDAPGIAEIIVVDDESGDDTGPVAERGGAVVLAGTPLPPGWAGKAWALHQGVRHATTEWVVTLDADTRPVPALPAALVDRARRDHLDLVTVAGAFETPTAGVAWLHPALLTTLVYRFGRPGVNRSGRAWANGQCMAARRTDLLTWLEAVGDSVVEDVALARTVTGEGAAVALLDGSAVLTVRMFEDLSDTVRGWGRSVALPGIEARPQQLLDLGLIATTTVLPLVRLARRRADLVDLALVALRIGTLVGTRRVYPGAAVTYWLSPLADPVATVVLAAGIMRGRRQRWRGRSYG